MVTALPSTLIDSAIARRSWGAPDAPVRKAEPPTPVASHHRDASEDATYASPQFLAPFVAQVLAQFDAATPADPEEATAAYRRATEIRFEPVDLLPPL